MAPSARTITVALDMSKTFDTINIHTLIRKLLQTNIPGTIIKLIANYIKGHKAYTTYRNHTSRQRQFKTGGPQGSVLSPTLFNIYTSDLPPPSAPVQVMAYADDITITSTHTSTSAAKKYIQPYPQKVFAWTKQNNLILNLYKTTVHSVHAGPCIIYAQSGPKNTQQCTTHGNAAKGSGSYLRPKTHIQHTHPQQSFTELVIQPHRQLWRREDWQNENKFTLINRSNDAPSFYSRVWHTTSTPYIALCTENLHRIIERGWKSTWRK